LAHQPLGGFAPVLLALVIVVVVSRQHVVDPVGMAHQVHEARPDLQAHHVAVFLPHAKQEPQAVLAKLLEHPDDRVTGRTRRGLAGAIGWVHRTLHPSFVKDATFAVRTDSLDYGDWRKLWIVAANWSGYWYIMPWPPPAK